MKDKIYEKACEEVRQLKEASPSFTRADRFRILQALTGVDEETARTTDRYLRAIREIIEKDSRGAELEAEWRKKDYQHGWENEMYQKEKQLNIKL